MRGRGRGRGKGRWPMRGRGRGRGKGRWPMRGRGRKSSRESVARNYLNGPRTRGSVVMPSLWSADSVGYKVVFHKGSAKHPEVEHQVAHVMKFKYVCSFMFI